MPAHWALGGLLRCRVAAMWPNEATVGALLLLQDCCCCPTVRDGSPMPALWALGEVLPCCCSAAM